MNPQPREPLNLFVLMALIAGLALGIWIIVPSFRSDGAMKEISGFAFLATFLLGGLSLVGPPLILWERRRRKRTLGAGRFLWFSTGTASWLLWPPIIYSRARNETFRSDSAVCFAYGTPLMALYVTLTLLAGGWLRKKRRRAMRLSWREQFGLLLGLAWASLGLYVVSMFWYEDFRR